MYSRRHFLAGTASLSVSAALTRTLPALSPYTSPVGSGQFRVSQGQKRTRIILLGTKGGPRVSESTPNNPGRSNPSTLILINDVPYVVDCGYGTSRQLLSAGVSLDRLRYIFITHHHSDHNLE